MKRAHVLDRIRALVTVDPVTGCWVNLNIANPRHYASVRNEDGDKESAHRITYRLMVGPIPDGLHIDHLCRNRRCCNPEHLEPVTLGENIRRGEPATRTVCLHGHPYTEENTYRNKKTGQRMCLPCIRDRSARHNPKTNAARSAARATARGGRAVVVSDAARILDR